MVRLTKIYTRGGDEGKTSLGDGARVAKDHPRLEAYGAVDELNAQIGIARRALENGGNEGLAKILARIQNDLFDVGADLCVPVKAGEKKGASLRVEAQKVAWLEEAIDAINAALPPLSSFILPGGAGGAAELHVARTVARRAERRMAALLKYEGRAGEGEGAPSLNKQAFIYMNRLSDFLFCAAREAHGGEAGDILWKPGGGKPKPKK